MQTALIVLRLALAAVFATAGVGKLLDLDGSRAALSEFGVPAQLTRLGAIALPCAELAVAFGLLIAPAAQWAAAAGVLLLVAFIAGIAAALARGSAPECHCFGQIHSSPAGRGTLLRNIVLAGFAGFVVVAGPGPAIDSWVSATRWHWALLGVLALLGVAAVLLTRRAESRARVRERQQAAELPGLPIGSPAPDFEASDLVGGSATLGSLVSRGKPVLLVFTHQGCGPCADLFPHIARWQPALAERLTVAVISGGEEAEHKLLKSRHQLTDLYLQRDMEVFDTYKMSATPSAVVVSVAGRVEGATVLGASAIEQLIRWVLGASRPQPSGYRSGLSPLAAETGAAATALARA